jgi:hypothetical protein
MTRFYATVHLDSLVHVPSPSGGGDGGDGHPPARRYDWGGRRVDGTIAGPRPAFPVGGGRNSVFCRLGGGGARHPQDRRRQDAVPAEVCDPQVTLGLEPRVRPCMRRSKSCPSISARAELAPSVPLMATGQLPVVHDKAGWERPANPVKTMTNCLSDICAPAPDLLQSALASPPSTASLEDALKDLPLATSGVVTGVVTGVGQGAAADLVVHAPVAEDARLELLPSQLFSIALGQELVRSGLQEPAQPQPSVLPSRPSPSLLCCRPGPLALDEAQLSRSKLSSPRWGNR